MLLLGATLGLALGLIEIGALSIKKFMLGRYLHLNPQIAWLGPLFYALALAGVGLLVWAAGRRASTATLVRATVFLSVTLGASGVFFVINGLHTAAVLLLALGVGAQAAMLVAPRWERLRTRLPRVLAACATVVALLGLLINVDMLTGGDEARGSARAGAPNILWIIWDTVRAENLSLYGYSRPTSPALDALARRGVAFDQAISPAPWTLPAHASMFTGLPAHRLNADWRQPFGREPVTVAEIARDHGYRTGGFVANLFYASRESGLARGFSTFRDYPRVSLSEFLRSTSLARSGVRVSAGAARLLRRIRGRGAPPGDLSGTDAGTGVHTGSPELDGGDGVMPVAQRRRSPPRGIRGWIGQMRKEARVWAPQINEKFLDWVGEDEGQRPYFAFLNYFDAHDPYEPPPPFDTLFSRAGVPGGVTMSEGKRYTPGEVEALIAAYDQSIAYADHHLAMLLGELDSRGLLENTIVVVSSDHGEEFGEHGVFTHGHSMYQPALRVPLVIAFPGKVPQGYRVDRWVTTADLAATVLSLAGIHNERVHGESLERWWSTPSSGAGGLGDTLRSRVSYSWAVPEYYPISKGSIESVFADPYKYILNGDGREELYDLRQDPGEARDLAVARDVESILPLLRQHAGATRDR
jgi:arylsulfatase A-like enzyme